MEPPLPLVPWTMSGLFEPLTALGTGTDCTKVPPGAYSSMKTELPVAANVSVPSPTRQTTMFPGVNGPGVDVAVAVAVLV